MIARAAIRMQNIVRRCTAGTGAVCFSPVCPPKPAKRMGTRCGHGWKRKPRGFISRFARISRPMSWRQRRRKSAAIPAGTPHPRSPRPTFGARPGPARNRRKKHACGPHAMPISADSTMRCGHYAKRWSSLCGTLKYCAISASCRPGAACCMARPAAAKPFGQSPGHGKQRCLHPDQRA